MTFQLEKYFQPERYGITGCVLCLANKARRSAKKSLAQIARHAVNPGNLGESVEKIRNKTRVDRTELLDVCRAISAELDGLLRKKTTLVVTETPCAFRWATADEARQQPGIAFYDRSREFPRGVVVIPHNLPDDFCCRATLWCVVCHEARPGHEYDLNCGDWHEKTPAREEGWAVYSLKKMRKHFSEDAQLVAMQIFLLETAKCFLEVDLARGKITKAGVLRYLTEKVGISQDYAERTYRRMVKTPGQGLCYYAGYDYFRNKYKT